MADLFADALMLAIKISMVTAILFGLCLVVMVVIAVIVWAREKARMKNRERGGQR
jgi:uncharacterized membrane protein YciS (DUF1049 family)